MRSQPVEHSPKHTSQTSSFSASKTVGLVQPPRLKLLTQIGRNKLLSENTGVFGNSSFSTPHDHTPQPHDEDDDSDFGDIDQNRHEDSDIDSIEMGTPTHTKKQRSLNICNCKKLIFILSLSLNIILLIIIVFLLCPSYFDSLYKLAVHNVNVIHDFYKSKSDL